MVVVSCEAAAAVIPNELFLADRNISGIGAGTFRGFDALSYLDLSFNAIIGDFQSLPPQLSILGLGSNAIGEAGAVAVANALKDKPKLSHVDLGSNAIGEAGAVAVADALKDNKPELSSLELGANAIGEAGAVALADALKDNKPELSVLRFGGKAIGEAGAVALADATT